jgi:hypothetical protein
MSSEHDYHIAAEADVGPKANRRIWLYFILLGVGLYLTILGLDIMYRFQVQWEKTEKIGEIKTQESIEQKAISESILSGEKGLVPGKKHVSINEAMNKLVDSWEKVLQ